MHFLRVLGFMILIASVQAALDLSLIVSQAPQCSQICSIKTLASVNCSLLDMRECLCTSTRLQGEIAVCVMGSCNITEQLKTTTLFQKHVCNGIKQESRASDIPTTLIVLNAIAYPILVLRLVSRWLIARRLWWDDWIIVIAALCLIPQTVLHLIHADQGFGRHFWDIPVHRVTPLRKMFYGMQIIYCVVQVLAKVSILCLYLRIFVNKTFCKAVWGSIGFLTLHGVIYLFCILFQCLPISAIWTLAPAKCLDLKAIVFTAAGFSIFEDFFIMLLPIWELRKLSLSQRKKAALVFTFALGSFASITSIIRLRYIAKFSNSVDVTWDNVDVIIWSVLENFSAVICSCVLCIRPLLMRIMPAFLCNGEISELSKYPHSSNLGKNSNQASIPYSKPVGHPHNDGHMKLSEGESTLSGLSSPVSVQKSERSTGSIKVWITNDFSAGEKRNNNISLRDLKPRG